MSHIEKIDFIKRLRLAIQSYQGFTSSEKKYGIKNIQDWIGENGNLDLFIKKFSDISLDILPFLKEEKLIRN